MTLPFVFVHGAVVWKVLLVVLVALSLVTIALVRRRLALVHAREQVKLLRATSSSHLAAGETQLHATLAVGSVSTFIQGRQETTGRTAQLLIEHEGIRIPVHGDAFVTQGSWARNWWLLPPRKIPRELEPKSFDAGVVMTVKAGDEVIVSGTLIQRPTKTAGYRESAHGWTLRGGTQPITFAAVAPTARAMPLGFAWWLVGASLLFCTWYGVLWQVGDRALATKSYELAMAMPGSRNRAIDAELTYLGSIKREDLLQRRLALVEITGECPTDLLVGLGRFEEALHFARRCNPRSVGPILAMLGDFRAATQHRLEARLRGKIAIMEGRWLDAAEAAEALGWPYARCLGQWLRGRAGETPVFEPGCDLSHHDEVLDPETALLYGHSESLWTSPPQSTVLALALFRGDEAIARQVVGVAPHDDNALDQAFALLYGGPTTWAHVHPALAPGFAARDGEPIEMQVLEEWCEPDLTAALSAARAGDGLALASVLERCTFVHRRFPSVLFGVVPLVKHHRAELAAALRMHRDAMIDFKFDTDAFNLLDSAFANRELARLIGDGDEEARWRTIFDRHAAPLSDPDKLQALLLWQQL